MRVSCAPAKVKVPGRADLRYVLYDHSPDADVGSIGASILPIIKRLELRPSARAWDFLSIALAVVAADQGSTRATSGDGWTRDIELTVAVNDPTFWTSQKDLLESALRFLTTDRWNISFAENGLLPTPPKQPKPRPEKLVCLLSGGLDSLVGALDLVAEGRKPLLVSQTAQGDKKLQQFLARAIAPDCLHLQLNHYASPPEGYSERSQRARSIIFIAYSVLAASSIDRYRLGHVVEVFMPENGFISLNIPLTPLRLASHSTRTTHPFFIRMIQQLLTKAGLNVRLVNPYQFSTKGEMLCSCKNQTFLKKHARETTSCGRFARNAFTHCGRCVPCLIRRAAFQRWGVADTTPSYRYANLARKGARFRDFDDVRSLAVAIEVVRVQGVDAWIGGALNSAQIGDIAPYRTIAEHGIMELEEFMRTAGVI